MIELGDYRSTYESLAEDSDFQELSPLAQAVFQTIKLKLGRYGISVFYPSILQEYHRRATPEALAAAVDELEARKPSGSQGWLCHQRNVWWIRNGLRYEPSLTLTNRNHRLGALRHARSLSQQREIAEAFIAYYDLETAAPTTTQTEQLEMGSGSHRDPIGITETETETETTQKQIHPTPPGAGFSENVVSTEPTLSAIAEQLETPADRTALQRILKLAPDAGVWLDELAAALNGTGEYFGRPLSGRVLGVTLRSYLGNGGAKKKNFSLFRGYLRNAETPPASKPPPRGPRGRDRPGRDAPPLPPTNSEEVRWAR